MKFLACSTLWLAENKKKIVVHLFVATCHYYTQLERRSSTRKIFAEEEHKQNNMRIRDDCRRHPISSHLYATLSYIKHNFFCLLVAVFFLMPFCFSYNIKNTQSHLRCTHSAAHWSQFQVLLSCFAASTIPRVPIISPPTIPIIGQQILLRMRDNGSN